MAVRVLIVDDAADFAEMFEALLTARGYHAEMATTATDAEAKVAALGPDVILLDLSLAGANGLELGPRLRELSTKPVRLVAVTGWQEEHVARAAERAGFDGFLRKPIELDDLIPWLG